VTVPCGRPERSLCDHQSILAAIQAGRPAEAADEMLRHLVTTTDDLVKSRAPAG
jgi:GntR family transcriptional repressor for pyruvate dehydrogenase complex